MVGTSSRFAGRPRRRGCRIAAALVVLALAFPIVAAQLAFAADGSPSQRATTLRVLARNPVLVRAGERVRIPVDAVCTTDSDTVCPASVSLNVRRPAGWRSGRVAASPSLRFDVTGPTRGARSSRAAGNAWSVAYRIRAEGAGAAVSLPDPAEGAALRYYVTADMPTVAVPPVPFGQVRSGRTALYLPWGSGVDNAGLAPGVEAATLGPSAFDVDAQGRVVLADELNNRVALFADGKLVRQTGLPLGPRTDVAFDDDGSTYVASSPIPGRPLVAVVKLDAQGRFGRLVSVGVSGDQPSELRTAGSKGYLHLLPLDAWVSANGGTGSTTGRPLDDGSQLLKVVDGNAVRLGTVVDGRVENAVELTFEANVGEIALAEPDGGGGYYSVVHLWQGDPSPADQYELVHVASSDAVTTFGIARQDFAEGMPLSLFRIGGDGALYQLTSAADGTRVVRFDLGGTR